MFVRGGFKSSLAVLMIMTLFVSLSHVTGRALTLSARIEDPQHEFVIGEPLKFVVTLTNGSLDTIRVVDLWQLDMNMKFMFMEIVTSGGERELRKTRYSYDLLATNPPFYDGEPLAPGDSVQVFLYPNCSYSISQTGELHQSERLRQTFPKAGMYSVRICYRVPSDYKQIWKGPNGETYSNAVVVRFREPSQEEAEILEPLWTSGSLVLSIGDNVLGPKFDEDALKEVIRQDPIHPLTKYAYFALAKTLVSDEGTPASSRVADGVKLFKTLIESYPEFRYEEVRQFMAVGLDRLGQREEAVGLMNETLRVRPGLEDNLEFMRTKIYLETRSREAVGKWEMMRTKP